MRNKAKYELTRNYWKKNTLGRLRISNNTKTPWDIYDKFSNLKTKSRFTPHETSPNGAEKVTNAFDKVSYSVSS